MRDLDHEHRSDDQHATRTSSGRVAADVMNPSPRTCSKFSRVIEAVMIFKDEECGMVPIIEEGKPIGVVTDRDVALALGGHANLVERPGLRNHVKGHHLVTANTSLEAVPRSSPANASAALLVVDHAACSWGVIGWKDVGE